MEEGAVRDSEATTHRHWDSAWAGAFYAARATVGDQASRHKAAFMADGLARHGIVPRHILDLGCGDGSSIKHILARFPDARATLVDWSPEALGLASSRLKHAKRRVEFMLGDANSCEPYADLEADVVLSLGVVEHFSSPGDIVERIASILPTGGVLILMTPNSRSFVGVSRRILQARGEWSVGFQREYPVQRLRDFCIDAGLGVLEASALHRPYIPDDTPLTKVGAMFDRVVLQHLLPKAGWYSFVFARKNRP